MGLTVTTSSFENGGRIPDKYSKYHDDVSPEISWSGAPDGTVEFAVICHDPDAPMPFYWDHWVVTGIPADVSSLPEGSRGADHTLGMTSYGEADWGGPMPPPGHGDHHYFFWVYALDTNVGGPVTRREFLERYGDNILAQERIVGTYSRAADA